MAYHRPRFEWDEHKHEANLRKHGVSFFEAKELLGSGVAVDEHFDRDHSEFEDRYATIGPVRRGIITVIWTPRGEDRIRVISARPATTRERARYHRNRGHLD